MALQTCMTIDATDDFDIRNVRAICLNAIPRKTLQGNGEICVINLRKNGRKFVNLVQATPLMTDNEWKKIRKSRASDASDDGQYTGRWEYFTNLEFLKEKENSRRKFRSRREVMTFRG
ncbi:hypothetical protein QE152_g18096 [Popillia japonica]|uniref:Uncharacterized protein n=1 Tax=Popillia japonica TaxID=7064 RepID=A0AAW1L0Z1_POPJA